MALNRLYKTLYKHYGDPGWWPANTPYEVMVGAVLTQNTSWENVEKALANLGKNLTPEFISSLDLEELAQLIRPAGFFNQKSRYLKNLTAWFAGYDYNIERLKARPCLQVRDELLNIKGVGYETADSILLYALEKPIFVVDAYTRRLLNRQGLNPPEGYENLRQHIEKALPAQVQLFNRFHALIVIHCKTYCRTKPLCHSCPLAFNCPGKTAIE